MKIGEYAFYDCLNLTSLVIGSSVTSIGNKAFGGSYYSANHLTTITLNCNSIVSKNYTPSSNILNIFGSQVKEYIIGDSVSKIGNYAFFRSGLTSVTIGNSVTSIGNNAFNQCSRLTSIAIPNSVTSIGESAFASCWDLSSVTIGNSVNTVGHYALSYCNSLSSIVVDSENPKYDSRDNCVAIIETATNTLITGCMNSIIPNSVTSIGEYAFSGSGLTSITIPNWVTSIGEYAFSGNTNLTSVTIGNSVTSIGNYVFSGCNSLVSIVVESGNPKYDSRDNCVAIIETATNTLIMGCKNSIIPNSVTTIGNYAFSGMGLKSVSIPNSVTTIGNYAFNGCNSLTSVTLNSNHLVSKSYSSSYNICSVFGSQVKEYILGNSVTSIGEYSFSGTTNVKVFNIPNSVKTIGGNAFRDCKHMYGVTIPESIVAIGSQAFYGCTDLNYIHSKHEHPIDISLGSSVFYNVPVSTCILKVPVGSVEDYRNAEQWNQFTNIKELDSVIYFADDNVKKICVDRWDTDFDGELSYAEAASVNRISGSYGDNRLFESNKIIESFDELQYFTSLASLNAYEFRGCVNLKRLTLPKSIGVIGEYAFKDTPWLDSIPSENGIKYYDNIAIAYDGETHDVSFKNDTRFLARGLFSGYSNIGSVTFPASISNIPQVSFYYSKIKKVIIPATIKSLAYNSFGYACIDTLIFEQSAEPLNVWSSYDDPFGTFSYAELGFVNISRQLVENLQYTVSYDEQYGKTFGKASITKAIITDDFDLTSMFDGCNLNDVEFPENLTVIGDYAFRKYRDYYYYYFDYNYDLTDVIIPRKVTSIGTEAFFCYLQSLTIPNSVKSIGEKAFNSSNLKDIYSYIKEPATVSLGNNIFWNVNTSTCVLHVPKGKVGLYRNANQWKDFVNIVELDNFPPGDVNGDGVVTAADVTALYDFMLNNESSHIVNGDQSGDGQITAADVTAVYDVLLSN